MLGPLRRIVRAGATLPWSGQGSNSGVAGAVDSIERSVDEVRPWALRSDGRRTRPRFLWEGTLLLNSWIQENAGRTPRGVDMTHGCYGFLYLTSRFFFSASPISLVIRAPAVS